ncbi:hypothetical protein HYU20_02170 [Candidatus Woesearchaeota archaeon]|nr:hypothetical protein [Candidatus Woesearchaeota archaeon]
MAYDIIIREVIRVEEQDDFYESFENYLDDDEISPWEEGFMRGFTANIEDE